jgi:hypothetical protein
VSIYQIDKGVPLPYKSKLATRQNSCQYPWQEMEVGDSFLGNETAAACGRTYSKRHPEYSFISHRVKEAPGYRIWRVK